MYHYENQAPGRSKRSTSGSKSQGQAGDQAVVSERGQNGGALHLTTMRMGAWDTSRAGASARRRASSSFALAYCERTADTYLAVLTLSIITALFYQYQTGKAR